MMITERKLGQIGFGTNGIQELPTVWEKSVRYLKLISPSGETIEFCQVL